MKIMRFESRSLGESYEYIKHNSGLDIYLFPKKMTGKYALLATRYGSIDQDFRLVTPDGQPSETVHVPAGTAHFLEHKMFDNEDGVDSFERFSAYGADANAYTTYNRTVYLFGCTDHFPQSLTELLRFVTHPYFPEASVEKEKGIIAQEIKMYDDDPYERSFSELLNCLYEKNPMKINICGTAASIRDITPEILYRCYRIFYQLSNMALVICGDVTRDEVLAVADRELRPGTASTILRERVKEPAAVFRPRSLVSMPVSKPIFNIGFKDEGYLLGDEERQKRDAAMSILNEMLFSRSGSLYNHLFETGLISPGFSYGYSISDSFSFNSLGGEADRPEEVLSEILAYVAKVKREGLDLQTFERCRRVMCAEHVKNFDSVADISNDLLSFVFDGGEIFHYGDLLAAVTPQDVTRLLFEVMDPEKVAMSIVAPQTPIETAE